MHKHKSWQVLAWCTQRLPAWRHNEGQKTNRARNITSVVLDATCLQNLVVKKKCTSTKPGRCLLGVHKGHLHGGTWRAENKQVSYALHMCLVFSTRFSFEHKE